VRLADSGCGLRIPTPIIHAAIRLVAPTHDSLPDDIATLKAMVIAAQAARLEAEAMARNAEAEVRARELVIEQMKFAIAKLRHERFGQSSERGAVLEQLELRLADMEEDAAQAEAAAQMAANAAASARCRRLSGANRPADRSRHTCHASG
jgi:Transposase C of IS166 homeodomain